MWASVWTHSSMGVELLQAGAQQNTNTESSNTNSASERIVRAAGYLQLTQ